MTTDADRRAAEELANQICGCATREQHCRDVRLLLAYRRRALDEAGVIDLAREAFKAGFDLASAATYRGGWEQAWEWSKIGDKVAALKSPT